ncbi:MAG: GNAT family N-acetyltransferase [Bacteroidaceae bacterium]|nr:GNAT family N-acetyltransferase [Bacteroidaceae bacterium]
MQEIIAPISRELLKAELTSNKLLRHTNRGGNELYIVDAHDAPHVMLEIGRLREIAFRAGGGGTGLSADIDEFDTMETPYKQLVVWNPDAEEIIGGYRYLHGADVKFDDKGQPILATSHMFHFSEKFIRDYLPRTLELGRSFVAVEYQASRKDTKGLFALDNLFDGLASLTVVLDDAEYFFGKMTMYPSYDRLARDMILYFLDKHFGDKRHMVSAYQPLFLENNPRQFRELFVEDDFKLDYRILNAEVRKRGYNIPPLVNAYMNLSPTMLVFGTAINHEFGEVEETGILINVNELHEDKRKRHIMTFIDEHPEYANRIKGNKILFPFRRHKTR